MISERITRREFLTLAGLGAAGALLSGCESPVRAVVSTVTPSPTETHIPTATMVPSATSTEKPAVTATNTDTATPSSTFTPSATLTREPTATMTNVPPMVEVAKTQEVIFRGPSVPKIAFTLDDNYYPDQLDIVCDYMEKLKFPVTLFMVGRLLPLAGWQTVLRRAVSLGCEIQNHTWTHPPMTRLSRAGDYQALREEIGRTNEAILSITGGRNNSGKFFRPPYGDFDQTVVAVAQEFGLRTIMWSRSSGGAAYDKSGELVSVDYIMGNLRGISAGDIVLAHGNKNDVASMPKVLAEILQPKNLAPVTLSTLLA